MTRAREARGIRWADASMSPAIIAIALALVTAAAYCPALDASFLNWDDNLQVSENPHVWTLSWETVHWAITSDLAGYAMPLTWLSHALDCQLYGLDPRGHHATSIALHVANTVLVFAVFLALTGARWRSASVAALFGLHPLNVEAVTWIAERKELLSAFFSLLTLAAYVRFVRVRTGASALAVATAFVAALLSKPMAVTLPAVLLLLDYWPLRRLSWGAVREKIPIFVVAAAAAAWAFVGAGVVGALKPLELIGFPDRAANALVSYVRYLVHAAWPTRLSPWYSHPALEGVALASKTVAGAAVLLATVTLLAVLVRRHRPHLTVGWFWYLVTLFPVIGIVQVGGQAMADRYTYFPLLGIFVLVVWELGALPLWRARWARPAGALLVAASLIVLTVLTGRQTAIWHDPMTFWTYTVRANPRAAIGYLALGGLFAAERRPDDAIAAYRRALKLRPDYVNAHTEVGNLLAQRGRLAAAAAHYRKAIGRRREAAVDHSNLANVLLNQDRPAQARRHLEIALALRPDFAEAHNNLGIVLAGEGQLDDAIEQFRAALRAKPDFAAARGNLAATLAERRRVQGGERGGEAAQGGP